MMRARPFLMPSREAAGHRLRLYVLGLALVRRLRLAHAEIPTLAHPPRNGGSPLSAGIPRPELRQGLRAYRFADSRKPNAQGQPRRET